MHERYCHAHLHDPQERVLELSSEAKQCHEKLGDNIQALEKYIKALDICKKSKLTEEASYIHGNCAHFLLQIKSYNLAYRHAHAGIKLCPSYDKVYKQLQLMDSTV